MTRHFLQAEDVLNPPVADQRVVQRQLGRAGVAEDVLHAGVGQHIQEGVDSANGHGSRRFRYIFDRFRLNDLSVRRRLAESTIAVCRRRK